MNIETTHRFSELSEEERAAIVAAHSIHLDAAARDRLAAIFKLGNPLMILGSDGQRLYCRIDASSAEIMRLLLREYLISNEAAEHFFDNQKADL